MQLRRHRDVVAPEPIDCSRAAAATKRTNAAAASIFHLRAACALVASAAPGTIDAVSLWLPGLSAEVVGRVAATYGVQAAIQSRTNGCAVRITKTYWVRDPAGSDDKSTDGTV